MPAILGTVRNESVSSRSRGLEALPSSLSRLTSKRKGTKSEGEDRCCQENVVICGKRDFSQFS